MFEITIDADLCKKDGLCAMTCPVAVLQQDEKATIPTIATDHLGSCFGCGQCVSICPHGQHCTMWLLQQIRADFDEVATSQ